MHRLLIALLLAGVIAAAVLSLRPQQPVEGEYLVFGTRARIQLRDADQDQAQAALEDIGKLFAHDHQSWHPWNPSDLTRLNDALAQGHAARVPPDVADMIRRAQEGYELSDGWFNAAAGKLIGAWGFHTSKYPVETPAPTDTQIHAMVAALPTMRDVHVAGDGTVSASNTAVSLDLNGLAEGYAAGQVRQLLDKHGIDHALIYIGGFVLAVGDNDGKPWRVGLNSPSGVMAGVTLHDGEALSSSGDYVRHRATPGEGGHIIDTRQGHPQHVSSAASVILNDPTVADMASTALMVAGPAGFQRATERMHLGCAMLLGHDGILRVTSGMRLRLRANGASMPMEVLPGPALDCQPAGVRPPQVVISPEL
ncbi:FAD:protein FMN transferase [Dyella silvae]|uniref:FAD:protein FMN transferase n=1 Tax=Dyella silvae TaxID=2994424 RepID=UPI0022649CEA|nr:FAD:protein FMN transferase [Dyella silvae]